MTSAFMEGLRESPFWVQVWVGWMILVNTASVLFLQRTEGRVVLVVWILNGITMMLAAEVSGYNRLLGIVHVIWWTPLLAYLWTRRAKFDRSATYGKWLVVLTATIATSLVIDYIDVVRFFLRDTN